MNMLDDAADQTTDSIKKEQRRTQGAEGSEGTEAMSDIAGTAGSTLTRAPTSGVVAAKDEAQEDPEPVDNLE